MSYQIAIPSDAVFIVQFGDVCKALFSLADSPSNWCLLGAVAAALGLSTRIAQRVIAVEGDGSSLSTVASYEGNSLGILILDNGAYESAGGQTVAACDLFQVAVGCGLCIEAT
ncbi:MAG: hypothetical protein QM619_08705 [Micropruina sp.]|uniref:hypothetical protein n=1 Tax=Micropruina sp. TaxID=2737536 RepID=UPI0039E6C7EC